MRVLQHCYTSMHEKVLGKTTDKAFDRACRYQHDVLLAGLESNLQPPSLYITKKVLGVEEAEKYEWHVCPNDCQAFPQISKAEWRAHANDTCDECGAHRFRVVRRARGSIFVPQKRFWYFGLQHTIKQVMFADPVWCKLRGTERNLPQSFYTSEEFARLKLATGGVAAHADTSVYDIGFDYGQVSASRQCARTLHHSLLHMYIVA